MSTSDCSTAQTPPDFGGVPAYSCAENLCEVVHHDWVNPEYRHIVLSAPVIALRAKPGQFFHLACPPSDGYQPYLRRPMSVYRTDPPGGRVEFLYKVQGAGTRGLATLRQGDTLDIMGPVGNGFGLPQTCKHVLMLARGVGLATMAPLAEMAIAQGAQVTAILSARSSELLMSLDYLKEVGAQVITTHDQDQSSDVAHIETLFNHIHTRHPVDYIATCGSNRLLQLVQKMAGQWKIKGEVALEQKMGCALGMCFACVKPFRTAPNNENTTYRRVCWDGPVFDVQETISW